MTPLGLEGLLAFVFFRPTDDLRPSFLSLLFLSSRNSDPGSHTGSRLFSPLPARVRALHFYRDKISALSSLVDSRRIVPTHAPRSFQNFKFLQIQL